MVSVHSVAEVGGSDLIAKLRGKLAHVRRELGELAVNGSGVPSGADQDPGGDEGDLVEAERAKMNLPYRRLLMRLHVQMQGIGQWITRLAGVEDGRAHCVECDDVIADERVLAVPTSGHCVVCADMIEHRARQHSSSFAQVSRLPDRRRPVRSTVALEAVVLSLTRDRPRV